MRLFPAIDLYEKQAVRLYKGDYNKKTIYSDDPVSVAKSFADSGAKFIHLVDLEGAKFGTTPNFSVIEAIIKESKLNAEIGGGIRSEEVIKKYIDAGAMRVILGTAAIENPEFLKDMVSKYGDKIAVGVDVKNNFVATHGWTECSEKSCFEFIEELVAIGVKAIICTDISKDGVLKGPNIELYKEIKNRFPTLELVASGGVSSIDDVKNLSDAQMPSAILGKALYEKKLDLNEALSLCPQEDLK